VSGRKGTRPLPKKDIARGKIMERQGEHTLIDVALAEWGIRASQARNTYPRFARKIRRGWLAVSVIATGMVALASAPRPVRMPVFFIAMIAVAPAAWWTMKGREAVEDVHNKVVTYKTIVALRQDPNTPSSVLRRHATRRLIETVDGYMGRNPLSGSFDAYDGEASRVGAWKSAAARNLLMSLMVLNPRGDTYGPFSAILDFEGFGDYRFTIGIEYNGETDWTRATHIWLATKPPYITRDGETNPSTPGFRLRIRKNDSALFLAPDGMDPVTGNDVALLESVILACNDILEGEVSPDRLSEEEFTAASTLLWTEEP